MHRVAVIIPACNEEACIDKTLRDLQGVLDYSGYEVVYSVGLNGTTDRTGEIAQLQGAIVSESEQRGYGFGCVAAINELVKRDKDADVYVFCAADGASAPEDVKMLLDAQFQKNCDLLLGQRTWHLPNLSTIGLVRWFANIVLGLFSGMFVKRVWSDLGPLRVIKAPFYRQLDLREFTMGWTAEMQMMAVRHGGSVKTCLAQELDRSAGEQKISGVSLMHSLKVGKEIGRAILRVARRSLPPGVEKVRS